MKTANTAITIACMLALSALAQADNSVSIRINNSWIGDPSFDVVSTNDHFVQAEFNYARRLLQFRQAELGEIWAEAAYMAGPTSSTLFGESTKAEAFLQNVTLSVRYAYPVVAWLVPYLRVGLGVGIGTLELEPLKGGDRVKDRAAGLAGHVLAGVELLWPRRALLAGRSHLTTGLVIEAGYGFGSRLNFQLSPDEDDELKQIPLSGVNVGHLTTQGWQLRIGGVLRF